MRTREILLSDDALFQIFQTLGRMDAPLVGARGGGAREYLRACGEWERCGLGEPDFDGGFAPTPLFRRILDGLERASSALRLERADGSVEIYLRGRVDLIRLRRRAEGERWALSICPLHAPRRALLAELLRAQSGELSAQRAGEDEARILLSDTPPGSEARLRALNAQMARLYPKYRAEGEGKT